MIDVIDVEALRTHYRRIAGFLDERERRLFAANEALALGEGTQHPDRNAQFEYINAMLRWLRLTQRSGDCGSPRIASSISSSSADRSPG